MAWLLPLDKATKNRRIAERLDHLALARLWVPVISAQARLSASALGPCRDGRARASAVINSHRRFRGTAGRFLSSSGSWDDARRRIKFGPEVGRRRRAADGQQPMSVTTGECARKPWRIMTAESGIDGH
jgi:hypothetical protein